MAQRLLVLVKKAAADAFEEELEGSWELESLRLVWGGSFL